MASRVVIGLDVSYTNTGIAVFVDGVYQPPWSGTFGTTPKMGTDVERADMIAKKILDVADNVERSTSVSPKMFIEDYAFARMNNREKMGELGGIVKHTLWKNSRKYETLPISTIRKVVTGKGNATKDLVMMSLYKRHSIDIPQNDLADAAAVGLTGDYVIRAREDATAHAAFMVDVRDAVKSYLKTNPVGV